MKIDEILGWIATKQVIHLERLHEQDFIIDDEKWNMMKGSYDVLEELMRFILMKTNPHNREDIKKANSAKK